MNTNTTPKPSTAGIGKRATSFLSGPIRVPKLVGSDIEWSNTHDGITATDRCTPAGWLLLAELPGLPREEFRALNDPRLPRYHVQWPNERDLGRRFLPNGSCCYMDTGHLETASPEMLGARQHLAWWVAMQRIVRKAQARANERLPAGQRILAGVRNSDLRSKSFGSHDNFLVTRPALERIFRHAPTSEWLMAFLISSILLSGAGKIGAENGRPACGFQISQRADFFECLHSPETMFKRPLINTRDEPHCGPDPRPPLGRFHCILLDANPVCQVSHFLKIGTLQIALAMAEDGTSLDQRLCLADPVSALIAFSHDPSLKATVPLRDGGTTTILDLQFRFLEAADRFVTAGCEGVPDAKEIIGLWGETLFMLEREDARLVGRLDWVHKKAFLEGATAGNSELPLETAALLDFAYTEMDWSAAGASGVEPLVTEDEIRAAMLAAPENTRAWTRSRLLELAPPHMVAHVDWDSITLRDGDGKLRTTWLSDPLVTKADSPIRDATTLAEALAALGQAGASTPFFQRKPTHTTS